MALDRDTILKATGSHLRSSTDATPLAFSVLAFPIPLHHRASLFLARKQGQIHSAPHATNPCHPPTVPSLPFTCSSPSVHEITS